MISSLLINFLLFWAVGALFEKYRVPSKYWAPFLKSIAIIALVWFAVTAISYLVTPLYFDHAESNIGSVAAMWLHGGRIYTAVDAPERYSLLYGPWPYLVAALFESFGTATIFLAKFPGVLNALLALFVLYMASRAKLVSKIDSLVVVGAVALALLDFYNYSYRGRPDSYLVFYVALSILVAEFFKKSPLVVYAVMGILVGLSINCKVHGAFYFFPIAIYYLESSKSKINPVGLLVAAILGLGVALAPFGLANVDLSLYVQWLKMAAKHGILPKEIIRNISFVAGYLVFLYALGFPRNYLKTYIGLLVSGVVVAIIAAKPGAGIQHFMPFVPIFIWFAAVIYWETDSISKRRSSIIVAALLLTLGLSAFNHQKRIVSLLTQTPERIREFNDLKSIAAKTQGPMELGYTDIAQYESSFYKPWLVKHGFGLLIDGAALMDMAASGLPIPAGTVSIVKSCAIPTMVFPKGKQPWSLKNLYDENEYLISEEMRTAFSTNYRLKEETEFFQVWKCDSAK